MPKYANFIIKLVKKGWKGMILVLKKCLHFGKALFILKITGGEEWGKVPLKS